MEYHNEKISMLIHPETVVEAMAQQVNDTYEEEGLEFCISYVVTDFVLGKEFGKLLKKNPEIKNPFGKKGVPEGIGRIENMGYIIGYIGMAFLIAFLIVYFGMRKGYEKKHNRPMSNGQVAVRTIGIGLVLLLMMFLGGAA